MEQHQVYKDITCLDLTTDFVGTAIIEGKKVFIENFLPKEIAHIVITEVKKKFIKGRVQKLVKASPMRRDSLADLYPGHLFGGCDLQTINYEAQIKVKKQLVEKTAKLQDREHTYTFTDLLPAPDPLHYRNKMHYQLYRDEEGIIKAGFYRKGTRELIEADRNVLAQPKIAKMLEHALEKLNTHELKVANLDQAQDGVRAIMFRYAQKTNQMMIIFIATKDDVKGLKRVARELYEERSTIKSVYVNVNTKKQGNILGEHSKLLAGQVSIDDELLGFDFLVTPRAFYQVNAEQTLNLYQQINAWVRDMPNARVLDLYAGTGAIGLAIAKYVHSVIGVDISSDSIHIAKLNAKNNDINNIRFKQADVDTFMSEYEKEGDELITIIDPPRSGCSSTFIDNLTELEPDKIIYVSCNPKSLIRDLQRFRARGYTQKEIKLYDMFPVTLHVESVCLLEKTAA